jgi:hypothetical protein
METNERKSSGTRHAHPVFAIVRADGRHFRWLAQRIGYSHSHVKNVACGQFPATPRFRAACARLLDMPESVLFHANGSSASRPAGPPNTGSDDGAGIAVGAPVYDAQEVESLRHLA